MKLYFASTTSSMFDVLRRCYGRMTFQ